ncbi:MAG: hypothetical protein FWG87_03245 [Defluviitaleaceae bacterium]|nr:hypothetical protein [Defluviitaleaceae bacterium]
MKITNRALVLMVITAAMLAVLILMAWVFDSIIIFVLALAALGLLPINLFAIVAFLVIRFVFKVNDVKKIFKYVALSILGIIAIIVVAMALNPLRWSEQMIRTRMLKLTPIGTSIEEVVDVVENNKKWKAYPVLNHGYNDRVIGVKEMQVHIGGYRTIFHTDIIIFYGFDEDSKLIDIAVFKEVDSL